MSLEGGSRQVSVELVLSCTGVPDLPCPLNLPPTIWLVPSHQDTETFAQLLLCGSMAYMQAKQLARDSDSFPAIIDTLVARTNIVLVERQDNTASLYAETSDGSRLAFLVKIVTDGLSLEGRGEDKELLAGVMEVVGNIMMSS